MQSIVQAPGGFVKRQSNAELFGDRLGRVMVGITNVVRRSLVTRPVLILTEQVLKDRTDFCVDKASEMRRDLGWPIERIVDTLPEVLTAHLDNRTWEPSKRQSWATSDGA